MLIGITWVLSVDAQVFTTKDVISYNINGPEVVKAADFNNDGYNDLIYTTIGDHKIIVNLFNPVTSNFDSGYVITTGFNYAVSLFPADLNGDGNMDFLTLSQLNNKIAWFKNDGNANFTLQPLINDNAPGASDVIAVDIDNDGDLDVVSCEKSDGKVLWYENDGAGNFSSPNVITSEAHIPIALAFGDLNNNGYQDILVGYGQTDEIVYFLNNGDGSFSSEVQLTNQTDFISSIKTADLNGDGYLDVISASKNDNKIAWYKNINGTSFSLQKVIADTIVQAYDVDVADFDLDNDSDLVCTSQAGNMIFVFKNIDGEGDFQMYHVDSAYAEGAKGVVAADFNNDGLPDFAAALSDEDPDEVAWYQNGKAFYVSHCISRSHDVKAIDTCDIDGDGDEDIFYVGSESVSSIKNSNNGESFYNDTTYFSNGYNLTAIKLVDLDNDNDKDMICADGMGDVIFWFRNEGAGEFSVPYVFDDNCDGPVCLSVADIDGDNDYDILSALAGEGKIAVYKNLGVPGSFQKIIVSDTLHPFSAAFIDINNDGSQDIIFSDYSYTAAYLNDGNGNFNTSLMINDSLGYADEIKVADINNDGYDDAVYETNHGFVTLVNNHDNTFTPVFLSSVTEGAYNIALNDMENDGDIDIFTSGILGFIQISENVDGNGTYVLNSPGPYAKTVRPIYSADLNNDGYTDLIVGSWWDDYLCWLENYQYRIITNPIDFYACEGGKAYFSVLSTGVLHYQWQVNTGSGFVDLNNNNTYSGVNKAKLIIHNVSSDMYGYSYRCKVYDKTGTELLTTPATLYQFSASIECIGDITKEADSTGIYTVVSDELDPNFNNNCSSSLILVNDYNNTGTLAGEQFTSGNYIITWFLKNNQNQIIDSCSYELTVNEYGTIVNEENLQKITIYPNPAKDVVYINTPDDKIDKINVCDLDGTVLYRFSDVKSINISRLPAGVYLIKVVTPNKTWFNRLIKL